jgi:signal transduction histidine kinase
MKNDGTPSGDVTRGVHNIATRVLELANTRKVQRVELLSLACELIEGERTAALLWLWDDHWRFLALSRYWSSVVNEPAPSELLDQVALTLVDDEDCPGDPTLWALGIRYQPKVQIWAQHHGFAQSEAILPVTVDQRVEGEKPRTLAFVQLLSSSPIRPEGRRNAEIVCGGLALLLTRSRDGRRLDAIQELLRAEQRGKRIDDWLALTADKLMEITDAEAAMMFREVPDGYEAKVTRGKSEPRKRALASSVSVVTRVADRRNPVRLRDFADDAEREAAFGTIEHDLDLHEVMENDLLEGPVRSVLLAPIVFETHTLAVIALVNKKGKVHLARVFSKTDEEVLSNVCGFLKGVLPSIELYEALGEMARVVSPKTLESAAEAEKVYDVLQKMIPAITGVALVRKHRTETMYSVDMFGGDLWTRDSGLLFRAFERFLPAGTGGHYYKMLIVPEVPAHYLVVELKRATTTGYQDQILGFFTKALSHILLAEQGRADVIETFAQLRHAVRTGITGVVGYVNESLGCFDLYRQLGYAPNALSQARFRKALERADFAAKKSAHLLEESRFLLSHISSESLKLIDQPVSGVIVSMLNTLRPFADERNVDMKFTNAMRMNLTDRAAIDRSLVEMMIFNIVDNAIKYSYRNKPLEVKLSGTRAEWELTVMDIGTPIHSKDMEAIFMPFTRRPSGLAAEKRSGTGLGLAVARQIARAHGGDIICTSNEIGHETAETTFFIKLPRHRRRPE